MFVVFKRKTTFDTVQLEGVKSITFDGVKYTVVKEDNTTENYAASAWYMWSFN